MNRLGEKGSSFLRFTSVKGEVHEGGNWRLRIFVSVSFHAPSVQHVPKKRIVCVTA